MIGPRDEYLCDGGDYGFAAAVRKDWQVDGLEEEDTVAHYDTVDGRTVVFVEVKTRRQGSPGEAALAVDEEKQRRLTRAAMTFLKRHDLLDCACRFDVIALVWPEGARRPQLTHYKNAFEAAELD